MDCSSLCWGNLCECSCFHMWPNHQNLFLYSTIWRTVINSWLTKMSTQQYNIIPQNLTVKWEISERKPPVIGSYQTLMTGLEKKILTWNIPSIFNMKTTLYKIYILVYCITIFVDHHAMPGYLWLNDPVMSLMSFKTFTR